MKLYKEYTLNIYDITKRRIRTGNSIDFYFVYFFVAHSNLLTSCFSFCRSIFLRSNRTFSFCLDKTVGIYSLRIRLRPHSIALKNELLHLARQLHHKICLLLLNNSSIYWYIFLTLRRADTAVFLYLKPNASV